MAVYPTLGSLISQWDRKRSKQAKHYTEHVRSGKVWSLKRRELDKSSYLKTPNQKQAPDTIAQEHSGAFYSPHRSQIIL